MPRRVRFASYEHQFREIHAVHVQPHWHSRGMTYGDGKVVMMVLPPGSGRYPLVWIIGEDGLNEWDEPFCYTDYFDPEVLGLAPAQEDEPCT